MEVVLKQLLKHAYAPYSNYPVAAIVETKDGVSFQGVNVENATYGATICAERNAINSAIAGGYQKGDFAALHLLTTSKEIVFPCYLCRQTFSEFFDLETKIILYTMDGKRETYKVNELVKYPFVGDSLC